jgi:hypothetical protein
MKELKNEGIKIIVIKIKKPLHIEAVSFFHFLIPSFTSPTSTHQLNSWHHPIYLYTTKHNEHLHK